jgi:hypothetical protein
VLQEYGNLLFFDFTEEYGCQKACRLGKVENYDHYDLLYTISTLISIMKLSHSDNFMQKKTRRANQCNWDFDLVFVNAARIFFSIDFTSSLSIKNHLLVQSY